MTLTRRHYQSVAELIRWEVSRDPECAVTAAVCGDLVEGLVRIFESDNARFDADRFREACGVRASTGG